MFNFDLGKECNFHIRKMLLIKLKGSNSFERLLSIYLGVLIKVNW